MFLKKKVSYADPGCVYLKYYIYIKKTIFFILIYLKMQFNPVMAKLHFQQPFFSLLHDPAEIILKCRFVAQETFFITVVLLNNFLASETVMPFFSGFCDE